MRTARAGFTLLEVLLAMTLMSVLAATLYASLHVAFRARDSVEAAGEESRAGQLALDMVRRDLCEALPPTGVLAGAFTGTNNESGSAIGGSVINTGAGIGTATGIGTGAGSNDISFYAAAHTPNDVPPEGDVCLIEFSLGADEDGKTALVRYTTTGLLAPETQTPAAEVLCRNVQALNFRFFDGTDWLDTWDSSQEVDASGRGELPLAVEVTLTLTADAAGAPAAPIATPGAQNAGRVLTCVVTLPCASIPESNVIMPTTGRTNSTP
jgi:prepilin-type N-terminal cleavage/methylation domain-containing protein